MELNSKLGDSKVVIAGETTEVPDYSNVEIRGWSIFGTSPNYLIQTRGSLRIGPWSQQQTDRYNRSVWRWDHFWRFMPTSIRRLGKGAPVDVTIYAEDGITVDRRIRKPRTDPRDRVMTCLVTNNRIFADNTSTNKP